MFTIENYIKGCTEAQAAIFGYLREIILSCSVNIKEEMSNCLPMYDYYGKVCYVKNNDDGTTALSFFNGIELEDPTQELKYCGDFAERSIFFKNFKEIDTDKTLSFIKQALLINKINTSKFEGFTKQS